MLWFSFSDKSTRLSHCYTARYILALLCSANGTDYCVILISSARYILALLCSDDSTDYRVILISSRRFKCAFCKHKYTNFHLVSWPTGSHCKVFFRGGGLSMCLCFFFGGVFPCVFPCLSRGLSMCLFVVFFRGEGVFPCVFFGGCLSLCLWLFLRGRGLSMCLFVVFFRGEGSFHVSFCVLIKQLELPYQYILDYVCHLHYCLFTFYYMLLSFYYVEDVVLFCPVQSHRVSYGRCCAIVGAQVQLRVLSCYCFESVFY